tara:strand:- start:275 stop:715 length:441 start_codon:yes stop_codon:yes gene_type:complete
MKKMIRNFIIFFILGFAMFQIIGCDLPTQPKEINELDEIEIILKSVNDEDVPMTFSKGDDDKKGKGKKGKGRKPSFRKVIHRLDRYLTNHPNEEVQGYLDTAVLNLAVLRQMKQDGVKDGFKELVKETRQLLRKAIKSVRKARKGD